MMATLLFALTALVVLAPMLPALIEWRRPSDVAPLHIDAQDALDPTWPARSAAARVLDAIANGAAEVGGQIIACAPQVGYWPLDTDERAARQTHRVWHARGSALLPSATRFASDVVAEGCLETSPASVCARLWSADRLRLADATVIEQWAHGASIEIGADCRLGGRVTAATAITLSPGSRFTLLQAPSIRFSPDPSLEHVRIPPAPPASDLPPLLRDAASGRRFSRESLDLGARRSWSGDLVCHGDLVLGAGCRSIGNIKVTGRLVVGPGCVIDGALVAVGPIEIDRASVVVGAVVSEQAVHLAAGSCIGTLDRPATVSAPRITVGAAVTVHGTIWAGSEGRIEADANADAGAAAVEWSVAAGAPRDSSLGTVERIAS